MSNQDPSPPPSFDQIVKGDVCIKKIKNKKNMYRITFSKIGKFLLYQVWDKDNVGNQNAERSVFRVSAKDWVNEFIKQNKDLKEKGKELFTPTTIMETVDGDQYAFVIRKAYFDSHDRIVFTVSTKEIKLANNCSKKLINIQPGCYNNMRFDIDENSDNCLLIEDFVTCLEGQDLIDELIDSFGINQNPKGIVQVEQSRECRLCWQNFQHIDMPYNKDFYYIKPGVKLNFCDKTYETKNGLKGAYTCASFRGITEFRDGDRDEQYQCLKNYNRPTESYCPD